MALDANLSAGVQLEIDPNASSEAERQMYNLVVAYNAQVQMERNQEALSKVCQA